MTTESIAPAYKFESRHPGGPVEITSHPLPNLWNPEWRASSAITPTVELFGPYHEIVFHDEGEITMNLGLGGEANRIIYFTPKEKQLVCLKYNWSYPENWAYAGPEQIGSPDEHYVPYLYTEMLHFVQAVYEKTQHDSRKQASLRRQLTPLIRDLREQMYRRPNETAKNLDKISAQYKDIFGE